MARKTSTVDNDKLEHTEGGATTRDAMDAGVPMTPGQPDEPIGPEDAMGPGPKRGDYSDRIDAGPHMVTRVNPDADVDKGEPRYELVPADAEVTNIGDAPGKGGVSTAEAREVAADTSGAPEREEG
jgi:hypothetical protein